MWIGFLLEVTGTDQFTPTLRAIPLVVSVLVDHSAKREQPLFALGRRAVAEDRYGGHRRQEQPDNEPIEHRYQSEYGVPSRLVLSDPLRTSNKPGSVWLTLDCASSMIGFQVSAELVIGSIGICRR